MRHPPHSLPRRCFLRALGGGIFTSSVGHVFAAPAALTITVDRVNWGGASQQEIEAVVRSAAGEIWKHCPASQLDPVRVYRRTDYPQIDFRRDSKGRISIGLATGDTYWSQYAYQFAHEFCHALAQHSDAAKRGRRTDGSANLWFEESLCETASLFALRRMAATWRTAPPYPQWRSYAKALADYASERLADKKHQLPDGETFATWFQKNEPALRANGAMREKTRSSPRSSCRSSRPRLPPGRPSAISISARTTQRNRSRFTSRNGGRTVRPRCAPSSPGSRVSSACRLEPG